MAEEIEVIPESDGRTNSWMRVDAKGYIGLKELDE
jgi:hypothetical protein